MSRIDFRRTSTSSPRPNSPGLCFRPERPRSRSITTVVDTGRKKVWIGALCCLPKWAGSLRPPDQPEALLDRSRAMTGFEIYCPQCRWKPQPGSRWQCIPSCGTVWNTFWTRGVCPGCGYTWQRTQCLACGEVSRHIDWYHYPEDSSHEDGED